VVTNSWAITEFEAGNTRALVDVGPTVAFEIDNKDSVQLRHYSIQHPHGITGTGSQRTKTPKYTRAEKQV